LKQIHWLLIVAVLSLSVVRFANAGTKETVSGDTYQSPLANFTVPLPSWQGLQISDKSDSDSGRVTFFADLGQLRAVTYLRNPADSESVFKGEERDTAYKGFLKVYIWPSLYGRAPKGAQIVHEEFVGDGDGRAYFAVVNIPEGSTLTDVKVNKRRDSVRGLIIFEKRGFMYMVEQEMNSISSAVTATALTSGQLESLRTDLKKVRDSMIFK